MTHSQKTNELIRTVNDFRDALDYKEFCLQQSLIHDATKFISPLTIGDTVYIPSLKKTGYIYGFEFDAINQPLLVLARTTKYNIPSMKLFSQRFNLHEIEKH